MLYANFSATNLPQTHLKQFWFESKVLNVTATGGLMDRHRPLRAFRLHLVPGCAGLNSAYDSLNTRFVCPLFFPPFCCVGHWFAASFLVYYLM